MGLELFMLDGVDAVEAVQITEKVVRIMPPDFFSRVHFCSPAVHDYVCEVTVPKIHMHYGDFRPVKPEQCTKENRYDGFFKFNRFCFLDLPKLVTDTHFMIIHRDGHPINPHLWRPEVLHYDYIGAPWPPHNWTHGHRVGNGGFCIRSRRLALRAAELVPAYAGCGNEDVLISCSLHSRLCEAGFRFAPLETAARFSIENELKEYPDLRPADTFGFHGPTWQAQAKQIFNSL